MPAWAWEPPPPVESWHAISNVPFRVGVNVRVTFLPGSTATSAMWGVLLRAPQGVRGRSGAVGLLGEMHRTVDTKFRPCYVYM